MADRSPHPASIIVEMQCDVGEVDVDEVLSLVTRDWVSAALARKYPGAVVEHMEIVRVLAGNSTKIWMNLDYNDAGRAAGLPRSVIVKAGFNRHDPVMLFTYQAEMQAYRDVLPRFPLNAPQCYYAGEGPGDVAAAIIMEDLRQRDIRFCHASEPLNRQEAMAFVEKIAERHAQSWDHPALTDGSWTWPEDNRRILAELSDYFAMLQSPGQWAHFISLPRCQAVSFAFHDRDRFLRAMGRLAEINAAQPRIVMVGDTHLSNLYLEADGTPGFLDFLSRVSCWADELSYFIGAALDMQDRRAWERDLLRHYLDTLALNGVTPPAFDDAWIAYGNNLLTGLFVWMTNGEHFQTEAVNTANAARLNAAMIDHGAWERLLGQDVI